LNDLGVCCSGTPGLPPNLPICGSGSYYPHPWNNKACYSDVHGARSYPEAQEVCKNWGGDLFSYENHNELAVAQEILGRKTNFWIALRKRRGRWIFEDGEKDGYALNDYTVYTHTHTHTHTYIHMYVFMYVFMYVCMCVCIIYTHHTHTHTHTHTRMYIYIKNRYALNRWSPGHPTKDPDTLCGAQVC